MWKTIRSCMIVIYEICIPIIGISIIMFVIKEFNHITLLENIFLMNTGFAVCL